MTPQELIDTCTLIMKDLPQNPGDARARVARLRVRAMDWQKSEVQVGYSDINEFFEEFAQRAIEMFGRLPDEYKARLSEQRPQGRENE